MKPSTCAPAQRQKALIDRAADALGRNRSDFMLETACREAESVLLDRRYFALSGEEFKRFTSMLDKPPASNAQTAAPAENESALGTISSGT